MISPTLPFSTRTFIVSTPPESCILPSVTLTVSPSPAVSGIVHSSVVSPIVTVSSAPALARVTVAASE